ncbi:hypothetical protein AWB68_05877 [Caballeronia choica]|uniref:Uncharacterized protein n=1 Tax=Caballeronia choica TaxID=326476 RepID=A0A158KJD4_9BURK|nr:hypothetical protein AWB68_05877 [Caballeronia choica]
MIAANRRAEIEKSVRGTHREVIQGAKLRYRCGLPPYPQFFSPNAAIEKYPVRRNHLMTRCLR